MLRKCTNLTPVLVAALLAGGAIAAEPGGRTMHHRLAKDVDAFHAVLAPLWHARPGTERSLEVCAKANELESLARDIRSADAKALAAAAAALGKQCRTTPAEIDAALFDVHEAFHRLADSKANRAMRPVSAP